MASPLDNPIWNSLLTSHAEFAAGGELARRYSPEVAPFAAVGEDTVEAGRALAELVEPGQTVCLLAVKPLIPGWEVVKSEQILQLTFEGALPAMPTHPIVLLGPSDRSAMLALTGLVYPNYFRAETAALGDYFGLWADGRLVAMAGTRMGFPGYREISAVCTHPTVRGKGYARALIERLILHIVEKGEQPFLHTEADNPAKVIYEKLGFAPRVELPLWLVRRPTGENLPPACR